MRRVGNLLDGYKDLCRQATDQEWERQPRASWRTAKAGFTIYRRPDGLWRCAARCLMCGVLRTFGFHGGELEAAKVTAERTLRETHNCRKRKEGTDEREMPLL